jgi:hypothetical protein
VTFADTYRIVVGFPYIRYNRVLKNILNPTRTAKADNDSSYLEHKQELLQKQSLIYNITQANDFLNQQK